MIIAVEGNVHVGKTTFINNFKKENNEYVIVSESKLIEGKSQFQTQLNYLSQEICKCVKYKNQSKLIMDRSVLSVLCWTKFTNYLSNKEKKNFFKMVISCIRKKHILVPNQIFFIKCDENEIINNHERLKKIKGTQDTLATQSYINFYEEFFSVIFKNCDKKSEYVFPNRIIAIYDCEKLFNNISLLMEGL